MERSAIHTGVGSVAAEVAPALRGRSDAAQPPPPPAPPMGAQRPASDAEVIAKQAASEVAVNLRQTFARFMIDHDTHEVSVQIVDSESNEVLRTIPNEDLRRMAQQFRATQGFVLDSAV